MYTYSVFSVKSEIAKHYFYKSDILYRFLKEFRENRKSPFIQPQYEYITKQFTLDMLSASMQMPTNQPVIEKRERYMRLYLGDKQLSIYEDERHLLLTCDSIEDAESFLFPIFRRLPFHFFVINHHTNDYGWLSTLKSNNMISKQTLYSFH